MCAAELSFPCCSRSGPLSDLSDVRTGEHRACWRRLRGIVLVRHCGTRRAFEMPSIVWAAFACLLTYPGPGATTPGLLAGQRIPGQPRLGRTATTPKPRSMAALYGPGSRPMAQAAALLPRPCRRCNGTSCSSPADAFQPTACILSLVPAGTAPAPACIHPLALCRFCPICYQLPLC